MYTPTEPIVIATQNPHKVDELRALLGDLRLIGLADLDTPPGGWPEPEETGDAFERNAEIKALAYATMTGKPCLADDSGLEVDALDGAPGVISSHYFANGDTSGGRTRDERDRLNNERLLRELEHVEPDERDARFVCVMTLAEPPRGDTPARVVASVRGTFEGVIGMPGPASRGGVPRGNNGFGYDPLFLVKPALRLTSAEMSAEEKNRLSHRADAARKLRAVLG